MSSGKEEKLLNRASESDLDARQPESTSLRAAESSAHASTPLVQRITRLKLDVLHIYRSMRQEQTSTPTALGPHQLDWHQLKRFCLIGGLCLYGLGVMHEHWRLRKVSERIAAAALGKELPALIVTSRWNWLKLGALRAAPQLTFADNDRLPAFPSPTLPGVPLLLMALLWPLNALSEPLADLSTAANVSWTMVYSLFKFARAASKRANLMRRPDAAEAAANAVSAASAMAVS